MQPKNITKNAISLHNAAKPLFYKNPLPLFTFGHFFGQK
jgi:hypothetical protein